MNMDVPMRISNDAYQEFANERIADIKKAFIRDSLPTSSYVIAVQNREDAIRAVPLEHVKPVDDLVDAMELQSYELQLACYLQGLADGGFTLAQLGQFVCWEGSI